MLQIKTDTGEVFNFTALPLPDGSTPVKSERVKIILFKIQQEK